MIDSLEPLIGSAVAAPALLFNDRSIWNKIAKFPLQGTDHGKNG